MNGSTPPSRLDGTPPRLVVKSTPTEAGANAAKSGVLLDLGRAGDVSGEPARCPGDNDEIGPRGRPGVSGVNRGVGGRSPVIRAVITGPCVEFSPSPPTGALR
jgi:hypothetical protein